jgi:hypothetical protein
VTHDELLTKIDSFSCCSGAHELALRAVVELHKPVQHEEGNWCSGCSATEWYPCPTIQAIEKELV